MACRLALALLLAANVHEPRRIHTCKFTSGANRRRPPRLLQRETYSERYNARAPSQAAALGGYKLKEEPVTCPRTRQRPRTNLTAVSLVRGSRIERRRVHKMIVLGLQAHNYWGGLISYFNADRGGQAYAYKPELP